MTTDLAAKLLAAIRAAGTKGLTGTEQRNALHRRGNAGALRRQLEDAGLVTTRTITTGGRPQAVTVAVEHPSPKATPPPSDRSSPQQPTPALPSHCTAWVCDQPALTTTDDGIPLCWAHRRWLQAGHTLDGPAPW